MSDRVLVTGVSGFIAGHVALQLLERGYRVRGTVRRMDRAREVETMLRAAGADTGRLDFAEADLNADAGWSKAVAGCRYVVHTASPFPAWQPRDRFALMPTAAGGALRVVRAAQDAGAERIVMTSSVVAVYLGHGERADHLWSEADWSDVNGPGVHAYGASKTAAERAAWTLFEGGRTALATINPAFVLGPVLGRRLGTSAGVVATMMRGRMPAVPNVALGIVDVRDVALAHILAMDIPEAGGRRFLLSAGTRTLKAIGDALGASQPPYARRVPRYVLPDGMVHFAARLIPQARTLVPELGRAKRFDVGPAESILGMTLRPPEEAIDATAASLVRQRLV